GRGGGAGGPDGPSGGSGGASGGPGGAPGAAGAAEAGRGGRGGGRGGGGFGGENYGFYLPFNWRGFYDFGSSLIGDWGVHILGPANWGLQLSPDHLISVECIKKDSLPPFTFPDELTIKYEFAARPGMPPVTIYWYHHKGGDAYLPQGMSAEEARKIADTGPQVGPSGGGRWGSRGPGGPGAGPGSSPAPAGATPRVGPGSPGGNGGPCGQASAGAPTGAGGPGGAARPEGAAGGPAAGRSGERPRGFGRGGFPGGGSGYNCIFVGSKGYLGTSGRGE